MPLFCSIDFQPIQFAHRSCAPEPDYISRYANRRAIAGKSTHATACRDKPKVLSERLFFEQFPSLRTDSFYVLQLCYIYPHEKPVCGKAIQITESLISRVSFIAADNWGYRLANYRSPLIFCRLSHSSKSSEFVKTIPPSSPKIKGLMTFGAFLN